MLGAAGVQIPENNLDDLHSSREEYGTSKTMDPQDLLGSFLLVDIDLIILSLLMGTLVLDFPRFSLIKAIVTHCALGVSLSRAVGFLRGTLSSCGCDPLALVYGFTPIEDNISLLETRFDEEAVFVFVFPEDVMGSVNLTFLSLFFGITSTNLSLELLMLGQV
ncbi:hypothetical protein Tco_0290699 [Tanacetum coccineum]